MKLDQVRRGVVEVPYRILIAGIEGCGKTTFASKAPEPIIICGEKGAEHIDTPKLYPANWKDVLSAIDTLIAETHTFKTVVIDTLDAIEPWVWSYVCERDGKKDIEDYGYGKGYVVALGEWRSFLAKLEKLKAKGINIILVAHTNIRLFKNPEGPDYDRYELKLQDKARGLFKEWVEEVLFAGYETFYDKGNGGKVKGLTGERVIHTTRTAAWDAKNRHNLPSTLPLDFEAFQEAMARGLDPASLKAVIGKKMERLPNEKKEKVKAALERADGNIAELAVINGRIDSTLKMEETNGNAA